MLTRDSIQRWISVLLLTSLTIGATVGAIGAKDEFDWSLAAVASTAFGTVVLAGFTGALAWTTSGDVRATWELAELTRKDQEARTLPRVLIYGRLLNTGGGYGDMRLWVVNAGLGPALRIEIRAIYDGPGSVGNGAAQIHYIGPGGIVEPTININLPGAPPGGVDVNHFRLEGGYRDMAQKEIYPVVDLTVQA